VESSAPSTTVTSPSSHPANGAIGSPRLDRLAIERILRSGKRLLVQGAMGINSSDGLSGKVAAAKSSRFVCVGTVSAVVKTADALRREIRQAQLDAGGGYVGMNLMAAINRQDFMDLARVAFEERVSFIVQGAGISREIIRWCREAGVPFAGIVSSGRLAAMYEKWGADFLVAEGSEAGGHIGDIDHSLPVLLEDVRSHSSLPVVAGGGLDASDIGPFLAQGTAGVQLATRFIASSDGTAHPNFKQMHLNKTAEDVTVITSCVKGMNARAVRNTFTDGLAAGKCFPPRSKAWFYGKDGLNGRRKACVECLGDGVCKCRSSNFTTSFCITDALLLAVVRGDTENGLFYSGQSVTRIPEKTVAELETVQQIVEKIDAQVSAWEEANRTASAIIPSPCERTAEAIEISAASS
jgi:nitronate monooxygenase